jgi:hypothetical protein
MQFEPWKVVYLLQKGGEPEDAVHRWVELRERWLWWWKPLFNLAKVAFAIFCMWFVLRAVF